MNFNKFMIIQLILFASPIFAFTQNDANQWIGKESNRLISAWGTPDIRINQRNGYTLLIYHKVITQNYVNTQGSAPIGVNVSTSGRPIIVTGTPPNNPMNNPASQRLSLTCDIQFRINERGIVESTSMKGSGC